MYNLNRIITIVLIVPVHMHGLYTSYANCSDIEVDYLSLIGLPMQFITIFLVWYFCPFLEMYDSVFFGKIHDDTATA